MEDGITRAVTRSNGTGMEDGITRAVTRERRKRRSRGEVVRGIIGIRGLGPCFYLSPFGMCLRGVSLWSTGGDPDPDSRELIQRPQSSEAEKNASKERKSNRPLRRRTFSLLAQGHGRKEERRIFFYFLN